MVKSFFYPFIFSDFYNNNFKLIITKMKEGEIYFNCEVDFLTGKITRYAKIGIVQENRKSEDRKKEHQTGNPREITIHARILQTPNAKGLESSLHNRFNFRRIHGEWFVLNDEEIQLVKAIGEELKHEQIENLPYYESMQEANEKLSNGETRDATSEELHLAERAKELTSQISILDAQKSIIRSQMIQFMPAESTEIPGVLTIDQSTGSPTFDKKRFIAENPELVDKYQKVIPAKVSNKFSAAYKVNLKSADSALHKQVQELPKENHEFRMPNVQIDWTDELQSLHASYLDLDRELESVTWELNFVENKIKASIGDYAEVTGIATWKRALGEEKTDLDTDAIKQHHFAIYENYLLPAASKWSVHISPFRAYPIEIEPLEAKYPNLLIAK
jgi:hypothetical protein